MEEKEVRVVKTRLKSNDETGRVKSMVNAIETGKRTRSSTLPSELSDSLSNSYTDSQRHFECDNTTQVRSEGVSPAEVDLVLNRHSSTREATNERDALSPATHHISGQNSPAFLQCDSKILQPFTIPSEHCHQTSVTNVLEKRPINHIFDYPLSITQLDGKSETEKDGKVSTKMQGLPLADSVVRPHHNEEVNSSASTPSKEMNHLKIHNGEDVGYSRSASSSPGVDNGSNDPLYMKEVDAQLNSSLQNLYQVMDDRISSQLETPSMKKKKKKKWRLFKKRKSTEETGKKYIRSNSEALSLFERVEFDNGRRRSHTHNMVQSASMGVVSGGGNADFYDIYMQDYSAKLEERKKRSSSRDEGKRLFMESHGCGSVDIDQASTDVKLDRGDATPPADMSPLTFKRSQFCTQLKFKLRSALQKVYCNTQLQLPDGGGGVARSMHHELMTLIKHALQRSHWTQLHMETALLSELLRLVEPLPNEL